MILKHQKEKKLVRGFFKNPKRYFKAILMAGSAMMLAWTVLSGCSVQEKEGYYAQALSYTGKTIPMSEVSASVENGKILIRVEDIIEKNIVYTEYVNGDTVVPLMAYVAESGRLVAAVSLCEPCRSTRFFIENNELVCSACITRWELDGMKPISGACMNYPPEEQRYEIQEGLLTLEESAIASWRPRD